MAEAGGLELRPGWLQRSLARAKASVEERPDRLKPERLRQPPTPQQLENAQAKQKTAAVRGDDEDCCHAEGEEDLAIGVLALLPAEEETG